MAERIADLYLDLSVRGADNLDQTLRRGRESLEQMGEQADETAEATRRAALRSTSAYERVAKELQNTQRAYQRHAQEVRDSAQREEMAMGRLKDARRRYGDTSEQAIQAEERWQRAQRESERASQRAERQMDQLRIAQQRAAQAAQRAARDVHTAGQEISQPIQPPEISDPTGAGEDAGDGMGGGFMAGFAARVAGLGSKAGPIGAAIAGVAAIGLGAGAMLANAIVEGAEREAIRDRMQANLGIDEATARKMASAASEAYMDVFGTSVADNMATLTSLGDFQLLDTSASQGEMEGLIAKVDTLNQMLGVETPDTLRAVSGLVRSGLAPDVDAAADLIVAARQQGLDAQGDLIDSISEYSAGWKNTGLSAQTTLALIKQSMSLGVDNTDRGADALREFGRRVTEEGDTIVAALNDVGLNGQQMYEAFKAGGPAAEQAFDQAFDKIRSIEDPVKRNQTAMALLGDTAGDFIGAFTQWDPSKAMDEFGSAAGAADRATNDLGANTATSWEGMRRTAEESVEGIKAALAEAFGPEIAKVSQNIAANKDEIVAFFADVVSAALTFGIGLGNTMAGALRVFGYTTGAIQSGLGVLLSMFSKAFGGLGGIIEKIPGMQGIGQQLQDSARSAEGFSDQIADTSQRSLELADAISDQLVPGMAASRDRFNEIAGSARVSAANVDFLRQVVTVLPDGKTITINDNSPETIARLTELGFKVTELPNGQVTVEALTDAARAAIAEVTKPGQKTVTVYAVDQNGRPVTESPLFGGGLGVLKQQPPARNGVSGTFADGGINGSLPDQAVIQPAQNGRRGLVQWAESDAGPWEAFIPGAPNKRHRAVNILSEVADRFGYSLYRSFADGGITDGDIARMGGGTVNLSLWRAVKSNNPNAILTSAKTDHDVDGGLHPKGQAIDVDPSTENLNFLWSIRDQLAMIISSAEGGAKNWYNMSGERAEGQAAVAIYGADTVAQHGNHIHAGALREVSASGAAPMQVQDIALTPKSSREDVARKIIAEGRRRGYTDDEIVAILATARGESNLDPEAYNAAGDWKNIFQQDGSYPGRDDPNTAITGFYDRLDQKRSSPGASDDIWKNIFWLQQRPGISTAEEAYAGGRQAYMDEMRAHQGEAQQLMGQLGPTVGGGVYGYAVVPGEDGAYGSSTPPKPKEPPPDPNTVEFTFDNPFQPFWWKGEQERNQYIIDNYEAQQAWDDYVNQRGDWAPKEQKQATSRKTLAEATRDLADAEGDLTLAKLRQQELAPDSKPSARESARQSVEDAQRKVDDAKAALEEAKRMPNPVKQYAMGDVRNGHQPEIVRPGDYRLWGEPESGGESYIPHAPDRRARALGIWAETGRILGVQGFDQGGFGGYAADTRDAMAPKNLYDLMALGVGGTMTALNTFAPYAQMLMTGQVDLGNMTPNVDLGANSPPLVAEYVGKATDQISQQLRELIWAVKDGKNIRVVVENATGPSGLSLTRRGK